MRSKAKCNWSKKSTDKGLSIHNEAQTCNASNDGQPNRSGCSVKKKKKQALIKVFDVGQADSMMFDEATKEA